MPLELVLWVCFEALVVPKKFSMNGVESCGVINEEDDEFIHEFIWASSCYHLTKLSLRKFDQWIEFD